MNDQILNSSKRNESSVQKAIFESLSILEPVESKTRQQKKMVVNIVKDLPKQIEP